MIPHSDSTRHHHHCQFRPPQPRLNHCRHHLHTPTMFVVKLLSNPQLHHSNRSLGPLESLISQCNPKPYNHLANTARNVAARLFFQCQQDAMEAIVSLWKRRLAGDHVFTPVAEFRGSVDSLNEKIRLVFRLHLEKLLEDEVVRSLEKRIESLSLEIKKFSGFLKRPNGIRLFQEFKGRKEALRVEMEGIERRIEEFRTGIKCVIESLEGKIEVEREDTELRVLRFDKKEGFDWSKLHCLILRESRRLEDGLPIYGFRSQILQTLHHQQVTVLIGETGSGKSTQLVQFLADSGVASSGSILCTQPRKIAAISLAKRVADESSGCFDDNSIVCYPSYSCVQEFGSKAIYMTDHCLLQHLMKDRMLSGVSCLIIDEAHERNLDTDLILALLKDLLCQRHDLRLIIMSATVDASKLSEYFFGCGTFSVLGRNFPIEIKYFPGTSGQAFGPLASSKVVAPYVFDVLEKAKEISELEAEGAILAFLTSQMEVEWACENFQSPAAVALALHGKLSHEEQQRVFLKCPGKRKVVFATNIAETSLTIPGVKYVVDCGLAKESVFDPSSGMNVLRVSMISQSAANQRAGRAGRTEPGKCYRLYSEFDYESMTLHQLPEILKVHIGSAVLRILALGIKNVLDFDFIDAPSSKAVDKAVRNLVQLGAITCQSDVFELTDVGSDLVKLGIEPRLGKIILECCCCGLRKEGVVLAAAMANASSIFCRVGSNDDKQRSDCLKVQFCHRDGDLFTLLSVYREWEGLHEDNRNKWCWENSINAKAMRRCRDTLLELENCLKNELSIIIPSFWLWNPHVVTPHDKSLKKIILSSLTDNVAMYSGHDRLGYQVVSSGEYVQLHPSCSLQVYSQKPNWVVFAELLSASCLYLVCVTAFDFDSLSTFSPPLFDVSNMESRKMHLRVIKGFGDMVLKRFCGKSNICLFSLISRLQSTFNDDRISIEVSVDDNEVRLFADLVDIKKVHEIVNDALNNERTWLSNDCLEKCLYHGVRAGAALPTALFGAGAEIKHLELENRYLTVDVFLSGASAADDKQVLGFIEKYAPGICGFYKLSGMGHDGDDSEKWGRVTFLTPEAAGRALELNGFELYGSVLKLSPSQSSVGGIKKSSSFAALKAKVSWPRKCSKGSAIVRCGMNDAQYVVKDCFDLWVGGRRIQCELSRKEADCVVIRGLDRGTSEAELLEALQKATSRRPLDAFLLRGSAVLDPCIDACEKALLKEITPFMPNQGPLSNFCHVQVFAPEPNDCFTRASITFDGRLHLEAAKALQDIQGKVLACCLPWQKMQCQQVFHSFLSCPASAYVFIERQLNGLLQRYNCRPGVRCSLERNENGSYRVRISANGTKTVAELRRPLELLMNGKRVNDDSLTPMVLEILFSRDGVSLMRSLQHEMGTYILFDRQNMCVRIFGPEKKVALAEEKFVQSLLSLHENKQVDICLRGGDMPHDLMKKVVDKFGSELHVLKEKSPGVEFRLNTRRHVLSFSGKKDSRQRVEELIRDFAKSHSVTGPAKQQEDPCPICLCEVENSYELGACGHRLCRLCLIDQLEAAMRGHDGFPVCCAHEGCGMKIWLADLRSLLSREKLEDLFRISLGAFVASSGGSYRFCPSPDCPSVYRVSESGGMFSEPFICEACSAETCTSCHLEYHQLVSCERYKELKEDPDASLKEWCKGKEDVKSCPVCGYTIEKGEGCNHVECRCGSHICWVCRAYFSSSDDCYEHLRSVHLALYEAQF